MSQQSVLDWATDTATKTLHGKQPTDSLQIKASHHLPGKTKILKATYKLQQVQEGNGP